MLEQRYVNVTIMIMLMTGQIAASLKETGIRTIDRKPKVIYDLQIYSSCSRPLLIAVFSRMST